MEGILDSGIIIINWLQSLGNWLTPIMKLVTDLGSEPFYLLIAPALVWCIDSRLGMRLGIFLMINGMVNASIKVAFHEPRPYWYTSDVKVFGSPENSFGLPSGHSQNAVVIWGALAERVKRRWAWVIAILLMFFIGLSRIYLGLHFPHDVLLGWLIGAVVLWLLLHFEKPILTWFKKFSTWAQIVMVFLFSLVLILIVLLAQLTLGGWSLPMQWVINAHLAFPSEPEITPLSYHNFLTSAGAFLGLAAGWIWIVNLGGFSTKDVWWKLVLRYPIGLVGVLGLYLVPSMLFMDSETFISYVIRYVRYAIIGFWISGLAPWLFVKVKLATKLG